MTTGTAAPPRDFLLFTNTIHGDVVPGATIADAIRTHEDATGRRVDAGYGITGGRERFDEDQALREWMAGHRHGNIQRSKPLPDEYAALEVAQ